MPRAPKDPDNVTLKHEPFATPALMTGPWAKANGTYLAGRAALDPVDQMAAEMETKWGCGRLRLLVDDKLREKFDRQRLKLDHARWHGDLETVRVHAQRMLAGYRVLDREAEALGAVPLDKLDFPCLETVLADGSVAVIVTDNVTAYKVVHEDRRCHVYTLEEIARLIDGYPGLAKVKTTFPGATVTQVRRSVCDPIDGIDGTIVDDEPPWLAHDPLHHQPE